MLFVASAVYESHASARHRHSNRVDGFGVALQLGEIPAPEFGPFLRIVRKPSPQPIAGSDVLKPGVDFQFGLLDASRPQTLHQESGPVFRVRRFIGSFQLHHFGRRRIPAAKYAPIFYPFGDHPSRRIGLPRTFWSAEGWN